MKFPKKPKKVAKIEIIPLIDIVFFLLATMTLMALSMSKNEGMKVKVPAASSASAPDKKKATATVTVMANGEMFFNKEKVAGPQLSVKLNALKAESKECQVMVNGDGDASWTQMVKAVDEIKKLGITNVGLSVERK